MAVNFRRTLVIGLGGTGVKSVLYMKKQFLDQFGQVPRVIQIRCIDTTAGSEQQETALTDIRDNPVRLDETEFYQIEIRALRGAVTRALRSEHTDLKEWFPEGKVNLEDIITGCHQERPSGRVTLFTRADEILGRLRQAYRIVRDIEVSQLVEQDPQFGIIQGNIVNAYIVGSLAGGTGAGMFLDIAYFLRSLMRESDRIIGVFLLPTIFESLPPIWRQCIWGNTYAGFKELDYWMSHHGDRGEPLRYSHSEQITWGGVAPFTHVFLIDSENEDGEIISDRRLLWSFIGRELALQIMVESRQEDILDNIRGTTMGDPWLGGKYAKYMGMGMSILELPLPAIRELAQLEVSLELIRDGLLTSPKKASVDKEIDQFITTQGLQADQILRRIIPDGKPAPDGVEIHPIALPEGSPEKKVEAIRNWHRDLLNEVENGFLREAEENRKEQYAHLKQLIETRLSQELKQRGGVDFAYHFLATLDEHLSSCIKRWREERAEREQWRTIEVNYPSDERLKNAARRFFPGALISTINDFANETLKDAGFVREITRRRQAEQLFADLLKFTEAYQGRLRELTATLKDAIKLALNAIHDRSEALQRTEVFTRRLDRAYVAEELDRIKGEINVEQHVLAHIGSDALLAWHELEAGDVLTRIKELIAPRFSQLEKLALGEILAGMSRRDHDRVINDLRGFINAAVPFWNIDEEWAEGAIGQFIIFGIPEGDEAEALRTAITRGEVNLGAFADHAFAVTRDPHRYYALRCKAAIPLYLLRKVGKYYDDYRSREGIRPDFTHHIHKDWANLPEVIPAQLLRGITEEQLEERLRVWTMAQARPFELIKKEGRYYVVHSRKKGEAKEDYWVKLGQGRVEAWEKFSSEDFTEVFEELQGELDKIMAKEGNKSVLSGSQDYLKFLKEWEPEDEELKQQVKAEYDALLKFIREMIQEEPTLRAVIDESLLMEA